MKFTENSALCIDGTVENLFIKRAHGRDTTELTYGTSLLCVQGLGIEGDVHANRLSPRQILITLVPDLEGTG